MAQEVITAYVKRRRADIERQLQNLPEEYTPLNWAMREALIKDLRRVNEYQGKFVTPKMPKVKDPFEDVLY